MAARSRTETGKLLHDIVVRFQVYLERVKSGEARKVDPALRALDKAVRTALLSVDNAPTPRQLNTLINGLRKDAAVIFEQHMAQQTATLKRLSTYAADYTASTIRLVLPANAPPMAAPLQAAQLWATVAAAPVQATGELLEPFLESWSKKALNRVEGAIRTGFAQGKTVDQIVRAIRGTKAANFLDGIIGGITKREASAVVRTALGAVASASADAVYKSNADLGSEYQWISTLDSRTSPQCRSLDGEVFTVGKGPMPPIHVNCRSTTMFIIDGVNLLEHATRASKGVEGGQQVSGKLTYYEWLKTQPFWFQKDALGKARAQLFRDGGLSADEFAALNLGSNFQPLTLAQMREKNPDAFHAAGL